MLLNIFKIRWVYHGLAWLLFTGFMVIENEMYQWPAFGQLLVFIAVLAGTLYLNLYLKRVFFDKERLGLFFGLGLLVVVLGAVMFAVLESVFIRLTGDFALHVVNILMMNGVGIGLQYFKRGLMNRFQLQELKAKTYETELTALKAQINPHFLFNTLNNIYGVNCSDAAKGSEMIMELAEVMRYHLQFSSQHTISLEDEIQLLTSYIALEKLRLNKNCDLVVKLGEAKSTEQIAPLLLLPFVENAFKHGTHPTQDCFVHLKLTIHRGLLSLCLENSIVADKKVVKTNIGLSNTLKRLQLIYPDRHNLTIVEEAACYSLKLDIQL